EHVRQQAEAFRTTWDALEHDAGAVLRAQHRLGGKPDLLLAVCPFDGADLAQALGYREPFAQVVVGDIAGEIALPDHGIIDPSLNSARTPAHHRPFSSGRRRFAKADRD